MIYSDPSIMSEKTATAVLKPTVHLAVFFRLLVGLLTLTTHGSYHIQALFCVEKYISS